MTAVVVPYCACGLEMIPESKAPDIFFCINCDRTQLTEGGPDGYRTPTNRDYVFTKVWRQRILKFFPHVGGTP